MANKRISELVELTSPTSGDILPIVNAGETKKISYGNLAGSLRQDIVTTYGLFNQLEPSTPISASIVEESLLGTGVGTLTVPANTFKKGDAYHFVMGGICHFHGNDTLRIRVKTDGITLIDTGVLNLASAEDKPWKLNTYFTINEIGAAGVAKITSSGTFMFTKNAGNNFEGTNFNSINNTTFDTTISNTLAITGQFNHNDNSIYSNLFTLNKTF